MSHQMMSKSKRVDVIITFRITMLFRSNWNAFVRCMVLQYFMTVIQLDPKFHFCLKGFCQILTLERIQE